QERERVSEMLVERLRERIALRAPQIEDPAVERQSVAPDAQMDRIGAQPEIVSGRAAVGEQRIGCDGPVALAPHAEALEQPGLARNLWLARAPPSRDQSLGGGGAIRRSGALRGEKIRNEQRAMHSISSLAPLVAHWRACKSNRSSS